jgi:hypothetical protein
MKALMMDYKRGDIVLVNFNPLVETVASLMQGELAKIEYGIKEMLHL